jgi:hypothetical protein
MARTPIKSSDRVKFSENSDGTYDLLINGRIKEYDVDADEFRRTLKKYRAPLPCFVMVEDATGYTQRQRISR